MTSSGDGLPDARDGLVAERDVESLGLVSVRPDEGPEPGRAGVAFASAPDRVHVRSDLDQLGEVAVQIAVRVRRVEQPLAIRPAVRIVEYREAREMDCPGTAEVDVWALDPLLQRLPLDVVSDGPEDASQTLLLAWSNGGEYGQSPWNGWTQCRRILHGMTRSHPFGWCGGEIAFVDW